MHQNIFYLIKSKDFLFFKSKWLDFLSSIMVNLVLLASITNLLYKKLIFWEDWVLFIRMEPIWFRNI